MRAKFDHRRCGQGARLWGLGREAATMIRALLRLVFGRFGSPDSESRHRYAHDSIVLTDVGGAISLSRCGNAMITGTVNAVKLKKTKKNTASGSASQCVRGDESENCVERANA